MADPFQPVRRGDPFGMTARTANGILLAGQEASRRRQDENQTSNRGPAVPLPAQIYNGLGSALDEFAVLAFGTVAQVDPAAVPFEASQAPIFEAALPTATAPFCITSDSIPAGGLGDIVTHGPAVVKVLVSDASHTRAVPVAGVTAYLASAASGGVPILTKESGTGLKSAQVLMGGGSGGLPTAIASGVDLRYNIDYGFGTGWVNESRSVTMFLPGPGRWLVSVTVGGLLTVAPTTTPSFALMKMQQSEDGFTWSDVSNGFARLIVAVDSTLGVTMSAGANGTISEIVEGTAATRIRIQIARSDGWFRTLEGIFSPGSFPDRYSNLSMIQVS